ncbi:MAG: hypothetical protein U1E77_12095 [Inhella sp.]
MVLYLKTRRPPRMPAGTGGATPMPAAGRQGAQQRAIVAMLERLART